LKAPAPTFPDLRHPDIDETPLSRDEILAGMRLGIIPEGPIARSVAFGPRFARVTVMQHKVVEVFNFSEVQP